MQVGTAAALQAKDELYAADVAPYFRSDIETVMSEDFTAFLAGAREVATLLGEARARQVEVSSLFLSALAGGIAGALISLLVH